MKKTIALLMVAALFLGGCSSRDPDEVAVPDVSGLDIGAAIDGETPEIVEPPVDAANILIFSDPPALSTGDSTSAIIKAVVMDAQNNAIAGHEVSFGSDGGVLQNIQSITDETGAATAELNLAGDFINKTIAVSATAQTINAELLIVAQGSAITMTAPEDLIIGDIANLEFSLLSGAGTPIPNQLIQFTSQAGNSFSQSSGVTNSLGVVNVTMTTSAGADVIGAIALDGTALENFELPVAENVQAVVTPVRIRVISNESVIETGGNDVARITTLVTDEDNRVLGNREVLFSSTGGVLQNISSVTNEAGQATAELSLAGDYRNQDIVVTAVLDDQSGDVLITAEGSKISVAGPTALVSGDEAELEITLVAGNEQPIPNEVLSISTTSGNTIEPATAVTDSDGKVTITVGSELGSDTVIVEALDSTISAEHDLQVAADVLTVVPGSYDNMPVSEFSPFAVKWTSNGLVVAGQLMRFSTTAGVVRAAGTGAAGSSSIDVLTNAQGIASVELSSNSAGPATVSFADSGDADPASQYEVEFVATKPAAITLNATPASVATGNSSTVTAVVVDAFGNPVKDTIIEFSSEDLRGGSLSPVSAVTDKDGSAAITFNAGELPTETDGITISAKANDFVNVGAASVDLTVTERQLNVIIGIAGSIVEQDSDTRYRKTGVIQVTDGAGRPVPDATIQMSLTPTAYRYGFLFQADTNDDGEPDVWALNTTTECVAEDLNGNRILDGAEGEDLNNNGVLDYLVETDSNGNGILDRHEDLNNNGFLDYAEDTNNNGVLDAGEDLNGNGLLDLGEDLNGDGRLSTAVGEDLNLNGVLDPGEDVNGNGILDRVDDLNNNGILDIAEDLNLNGILDGTDLNGNGLIDRSEDANGNGILDPRDPALVDVDPDNTPTVIGGQITTDSSGVGFFTIVYPQSNALYFDTIVTARVEALGVEGVAEYDVELTMSAADATNLEARPPNIVSPYGVGPAAPWRGCVLK